MFIVVLPGMFPDWTGRATAVQPNRTFLHKQRQ